jgi:excisionase family DNA binding protein
VENVINMEIDRDRLLTSHEVGELLQVNPSSIKKWVNEGLLPAFRTPGGHRRIRAGDLVAFLGGHKMPIPQCLARASKRRLLVVDDDDPYLKAIERLLKPHAASVQVALTSNGIDALVLVGSFRPHVMLLDVFMPELDGLEVCRRLKANPQTRDVAVFVSSGHLTADVEKGALAAGARRCLTKPVDMHIVLDALGELSPPRV